jgi:hypothetical protein
MNMEKFLATKQTKKSYEHDPINERIPMRCFCKFKLVQIVAGIDNFEYTDPSGKCGWGYTSGWNNSYHDAQYYPKLYAWGKGKKKFKLANKMMQQARAWYAAQKTHDPCTARYQARTQIRSGD